MFSSLLFFLGGVGIIEYRTKKQFGVDLLLMFDNCRLYNHSSTIYYKYANELQA